MQPYTDEQLNDAIRAFVEAYAKANAQGNVTLEWDCLEAGMRAVFSVVDEQLWTTR